MEPVVIARGGRPRRDFAGRRGRRPIRAADGIGDPGPPGAAILGRAVEAVAGTGASSSVAPAGRNRRRPEHPREATPRRGPARRGPVEVAGAVADRASSAAKAHSTGGRGRESPAPPAPAARRTRPSASGIRDESGRMRRGPPPRPVWRQDGAAPAGRPARLPEHARPDRRALRAPDGRRAARAAGDRAHTRVPGADDRRTT